VPAWKVVAVAEERAYSSPEVVPVHKVEPEAPDLVDVRMRDPLGFRGVLIRLAVLGAVCLGLAIGFCLGGEASLVMIAFVAVGLLSVVSAGIVLTRRPRGSTAEILGWIILGMFAALAVVLIALAAMTLFLGCLISRPPGMRYAP
jgi:hypothetical protein